MIKKLSLFILCFAALPTGASAMDSKDKALIVSAVIGVAYSALKQGYNAMQTMPVVIRTSPESPDVNVIPYGILKHACSELRKDPYSLSRACEDGDLRKAQLLLMVGAAVNDQNKRKETPLNCALEGGHKEIVKLLLRRGASPTIADVCGYTPLHNAVDNQDEELVQLLLHHNASINAPLINVSLMNPLRRHRATSCDLMSARSWTPLHLAAFKGYDKVIQQLLQHGASLEPNENDITPFLTAVFGNNPASMQTLVSHSFLKPDKHKIASFAPNTALKMALKKILENLENYEEGNSLNRIMRYLAHDCVDYTLIADTMPLQLQCALVKLQPAAQQKKLLEAHCERHLSYIQQVINVPINRILWGQFPYNINKTSYTVLDVAQQLGAQELVDLINHIVQARKFSDLTQELQDSIRATMKTRLQMWYEDQPMKAYLYNKIACRASIGNKAFIA